ncbi:reverse transcriptase [Gossypium australe]|uniref:Reverse transcriptase n=1 Tax=Gossypium australe TaxID=47621 RepID=A0A5B6V0M9_9ROSI|nr:reverse transcriptase [Gossypium australe]
MDLGDDNFEFRFAIAIRRPEGLITVWDKGFFKTNIESCENRFIVIEGKLCEGMGAVFINVYVPNNLPEQKNLWEELYGLRSQFSSIWIVGGIEKGSREFENFIDICKLVDLPLSWKNFTWFGSDNKRNRLDRFLSEESWLQRLKRPISDHILILLANESIDWGPRPFKFINAWFKKEDCKRLIEKEWSEMGSLKGHMAIKLQKLKGTLRKWNENASNVLEKNNYRK